MVIKLKLFQLWKESLRRYGQQFHQYQQNKQSSVTLTHWTQKGGTRDTSTPSNQNTVYVYIVLDTVCQLSSIGTGKFYNHKTRKVDAFYSYYEVDWRDKITNNINYLPSIIFCDGNCPHRRMLTYLVFPLFVFSELRWQMIVCFVDIGGIVDHLCLDFVFIIEIVFRTEINFHHTHIFWIGNKYIFIGLNIKIKKEILFLSVHTAVFFVVEIIFIRLQIYYTWGTNLVKPFYVISTQLTENIFQHVTYLLKYYMVYKINLLLK
jgi:hypothetical protein